MSVYITVRAVNVDCRDAFPVTPYHTLIIPKRHVLDYFALKQPEINAINRLLIDQRAALQNADLTIDDFNVGMNCGETAGQSVFHCHVHLIPRSEAIWRDNIYRARITDIANCVAAWLSVFMVDAPIRLSGNQHFHFGTLMPFRVGASIPLLSDRDLAAVSEVHQLPLRRMRRHPTPFVVRVWIAR